MWSLYISCELLSAHAWAQDVRKKFITWCQSSNSRRTDAVAIKQGLPSHQPITPEQPMPEEHQRILYPDTRPARQQCWARNSKGTQILKQQGQIYLSTSHTQVCVLTSAREITCQALSSCGVALGSAPQSSSWAQLQSKGPPEEEGTSQRG